MNILTKLSIKNIKLNKKRSISIIIAIMLATALICSVSGMAASFHASLKAQAYRTGGNYHLKLFDISENDYKTVKNHRDIQYADKVSFLGSSLKINEENVQDLLSLYSMDEKTFKDMGYRLTEGNFPENENEIMINSTFNTYYGERYKVGDSIQLDVGELNYTFDSAETEITEENTSITVENPQVKVINDKPVKFAKISGIYDDTDALVLPSREYYDENYNYSYPFITTGRNDGRTDLFIRFENPKEAKASIAEVLNAESYEAVNEKYRSKDPVNFKFSDFVINTFLISVETLDFSEGITQGLTLVAAIVIAIIIFTSVYCIRNSFAIALTEKTKMYSMLASVGATKKQLKGSVMSEALVLASIGIPCGIILGTGADYILVKIVNKLMSYGFYSENSEELLKFKISPLALIISVILGILTIYISAMSSAKRAAKINPVEGLKGTKDVQIKGRELKVPSIINRLFKTGGVIAYKNLKRSRKKYRTTVISIMVSVFIFISMSTFIEKAFSSSKRFASETDVNLMVIYPEEMKDSSINRRMDEILSSSKIKEITKVLKTEININDKDKINNPQGYSDYEERPLTVTGVDKESFKKYCEKTGKKYEDLKDKAILSDMSIFFGKNKPTMKDRAFKYEENDVIKAEVLDEDPEKIEEKGTSKNIEIPIGQITDIPAPGEISPNPVLVLEMDKYKEFQLDTSTNYIYINSDDPYEIEKQIKGIGRSEFIYVTNLQEEAEQNNNQAMIIKIFLYGFIAVITLISVTNIFNTITSNMELRQKEFAALKSIGMTKKEFNRMINLETVFYGTKSLFFGIAAGSIASVFINKIFTDNIMVEKFYYPVDAVIMSIIFVFALIFIIMRYSISKINNQNIIETIRNENI